MDIAGLFESLTATDVEEFVSSKQEETLSLDFKIAVSDDLSSGDDKKNFAKALSGFANSSGGLVVWGVNARKNSEGVDCAVDLRPLGNPRRFVSRLNELAGIYVSPAVEGVRHRAVQRESGEGFVLSLVPESNAGPHMAKAPGDDRYYKRSGDSFYRMEHFDIEDMFGRRKKPALTVESRITPAGSNSGGGMTTHKGRLVMSIRNSGRGTARAPYLELRVSANYHVDRYGLTGNGDEGLPRLLHSGSADVVRYAGSGTTVIHPNVSLEVGAVALEAQLTHDRRINMPPPLEVTYLVAAEDAPLQTGKVFVSAAEIASALYPPDVYERSRNEGGGVQ